jgi:adenylate cyclase
MAFWNAPLADPDQEANACAAMLDVLEQVDELNRVRRQEAEAAGQPFLPLEVGLGVNTGPCVVGTISSDRSSFRRSLGPRTWAARGASRSSARPTP